MSRVRRRQGRVVAGVAVVAAAGMLLSGCEFVNDVVEGQRLTAERLGVDAALRALTSELAEIDGVESAVYSFDAANVGSPSGLAVELADTGFALWDDVFTRIGAAGENDAFEEYQVAAIVTGGEIRVNTDIRYAGGWLDEATLRVAADAASAFPGSDVGLSGGQDMGASVWLSVPDAAEDVLSRLEGDPAVVQLLGDAEAGRIGFTLSADGLDLSGVSSHELVQWALDQLASGEPRMTTGVNYDEDAARDEWMFVSISRYEGADSVSGTWASSVEPGAGTMWDAFVTAVRDGPPHPASGDCVPTYLSYNWPGMGQTAMVVSTCGEEVVSAHTERDAVTTLREALDAEGVDAEALGFVFG